MYSSKLSVKFFVRSNSCEIRFLIKFANLINSRQINPYEIEQKRIRINKLDNPIEAECQTINSTFQIRVNQLIIN